MQDIVHYLLLAGVLLLLIVSVTNLVYTVKEYKEKEGYFGGGNGTFSSSKSGNGAFDSGRF